MRLQPTHTIKSKLDADGDANPFYGLQVTLIATGAMTQAGFDTDVALHCTVAELAERYRKAKPRFKYPEAEVAEWHSLFAYNGPEVARWDLPEGTLIAEVHFGDDLSPIEGAPTISEQHELAKRYTIHRGDGSEIQCSVPPRDE